MDFGTDSMFQSESLNKYSVEVQMKMDAWTANRWRSGSLGGVFIKLNSHKLDVSSHYLG